MSIFEEKCQIKWRYSQYITLKIVIGRTYITKAIYLAEPKETGKGIAVVIFGQKGRDTERNKDKGGCIRVAG